MYGPVVTEGCRTHFCRPAPNVTGLCLFTERGDGSYSLFSCQLLNPNELIAASSLASLTELDAALPQNIVTPCPPCGKAAVDYKSQTVQFLGVLQQQELIKNTGATMTSF